MGTTLSIPQGHGLVSKQSHDSNTIPSSHDDDDAQSRSISPMFLLGKEVVTSPEDDDTTLANHSRKSLDESDKNVLVNIELGDLMAYLQVVANHSNNLPQTCRDDPEGDQSTSDIPDNLYAKKSAAFIPSDIRIIGASFLKYGTVWDLPKLSEYDPQSGSQEPGMYHEHKNPEGRSYGGAISNAMLKVLYDHASNNGPENGFGSTHDDALFDDDEESYASMSRGSVPTLTSSRKLDVHQDFSIVPDSFDPSKGKKRCLLIGCNYDGPAELRASHDDIRSMKDYIVTVHGFSEDDDAMTVLLDDGEHSPPTYLNIIESFKTISEQSQPGDVVFVQFSGHGSRLIGSPSTTENVETYDEVIIPCDYEDKGPIRDTLIFKTLIAPMRYGVTTTVLIDTCGTGMVLDLPYAWATRNDSPGALTNMIRNENFSFFRFLKVVKTLYESSVFAQLGNRVEELIESQPEPTTTSATHRKIAEAETRDTAEDDDNSISLNVEESFQVQKSGRCWPCDPVHVRQLGKTDSHDLQLDPANTSFMDRLADCALGREFDDESRIFDLEQARVRAGSNRGRSKKERRDGRRSQSRERRRSRSRGGSKRRSSRPRQNS
eukprot:scaffold22596_cov131-Cylindrotheca_fusiformis.AAC.24